MEIGCINYKKPEVFLCHVKMQLRVMIILNLSGNTAELLDYVKEEFNTECITVIDQRFAIAYVKKNGRTSIYGQNYPYNTIPRCFGLMDTQMLEDVGVAQVRRSP